MKALKFTEISEITFEKQTSEKTSYFNSGTHIITDKSQIGFKTKKSNELILEKVDIWLYNNPGWVVKSIDEHFLFVNEYVAQYELPFELQMMLCTLKHKIKPGV